MVQLLNSFSILPTFNTFDLTHSISVSHLLKYSLKITVRLCRVQFFSLSFISGETNLCSLSRKYVLIEFFVYLRLLLR